MSGIAPVPPRHEISAIRIELRLNCQVASWSKQPGKPRKFIGYIVEVLYYFTTEDQIPFSLCHIQFGIEDRIVARCLQTHSCQHRQQSRISAAAVIENH